ncbi:unnamed protein product, partial [marine sediment metagenome]
CNHGRRTDFEQKLERGHKDALCAETNGMEFLPSVEWNDGETITGADAWDASLGNNQDGYGRACFVYACKWAVDMQEEIKKRIDAGATAIDFREFAKDAVKEADELAGGITGFMYGAVINILSNSWVHGEILRKWHNGNYGKPDSKGVVNPAIITIGFSENGKTEEKTT